jgi:hypothetical protein
LEVITAALWLDSPGYLAFLATFYPNKPTADVSAAGFASENEQVARVILAQGTSVDDEVCEAMANGGIYVVAPVNEARAYPGDCHSRLLGGGAGAVEG